MFKKLGDFAISKDQFQRFKSGELWKQWSLQYPDLFDDDDIRVAASQCHRGYHFHEWLAALLIYESTGYLSLIESYEFKVQKRKQEILKELVPEDVLETIQEITRTGEVQCPDLLCFKPDMSSWFFCEVKGPNDKMKPTQEKYFPQLVDCSGKEIQTVHFFYID